MGCGGDALLGLHHDNLRGVHIRHEAISIGYRSDPDVS